VTISDVVASGDYRKSSFSPTDNCVEVRRDLAGARDSKNGETLPGTVDVRALVAFVAPKSAEGDATA
jgi:hypothetical protein